jgi:hypothetical protein
MTPGSTSSRFTVPHPAVLSFPKWLDTENDVQPCMEKPFSGLLYIKSSRRGNTLTL